MDTLTSVMNVFKAGFENGITSVTPAAQGLYLSLLSLDFIWTMSKAAMVGDSNYLKIIVKKTMRYAIFGYFITNYSTVFHQVVDSLIQVGLMAGGGSMSASSFADPSRIISKGMEVVKPLEKFLTNTSGFAIDMLGALLLAAILYLMILLAFFIMAIQVFITYLEVYIVGTLAVVFLGCGVNQHTTFLAEKSIGAVLSFGIKLMTLAFILSVAHPIIDGLAPPAKTSNEMFLGLFVGVAAIAFLCWQAPSLAAGLMAGSPSLTAGGVAGAVMAAGAAAVGSLMAVSSAANKAGQALGALGGSGGASVAGATATQIAANAGGVAEAANTTSMMETSPPNIDGGQGGSGITAENVAKKLQPVDNTEKPESSASDSGGTSKNTGGGSSSESNSNHSNTSGSSGTGETGSATTTASTDVAANATQGQEQAKSSGITAAGMAGRIALVNSAIPPESSPQGGVGATIHKDD